MRIKLNDTVYLKTDPQGLRRMVVSKETMGNGAVIYKLACGTDVSFHTKAEITHEAPVKKQSGFDYLRGKYE